jgi:ribosome maturation factor RimP
LFIEIFQMDAAEEIRKIAEGKLKDSSQFVVDVIVSSKRKPQKVTVVVDGDAGISIDDCADISREVAKVLDDSLVLTDSYVLEVTTPGLDQPLKLHRQYKKNIGRRMRIKVSDKVVEGKLVEVSDSGVTIEQGDGKKIEKSVVELKFSEIDKSIVLVSFK